MCYGKPLTENFIFCAVNVTLFKLFKLPKKQQQLNRQSKRQTQDHKCLQYKFLELVEESGNYSPSTF